MIPGLSYANDILLLLFASFVESAKDGEWCRPRPPPLPSPPLMPIYHVSPSTLSGAGVAFLFT